MQTRQKRFLPKALAVELRRLPWRLLGFSLFALAAACWLALLSWSFVDPGPNYATVSEPHNWLGYRGASFADTVMEGFGLASPLLVLPLAALGIQIATGYSPLQPKLRFLYWAGALLTSPAFFASLQAPPRSLPGTGLGGIFGDIAAARIAKLSSLIPPLMLWPISAVLLFFIASWCVWRACGLSARDLALAFQSPASGGIDRVPAREEFVEPAPREPLANRVTSWTKFFSPRNRALVPASPREFWMTQPRPDPSLPGTAAARQREMGASAQESPPAAAPSPFTKWGGRSTSMETAEGTGVCAVTAAEDLAGFQSSQHREHESADRRAEPGSSGNFGNGIRIEPFFGPRPSPAPSGGTGDDTASNGQTPVSPFLRLTGRAAKAANASAQRIFESIGNGVKVRKPAIFVNDEQSAFADRSGERPEIE